MWLITLLLLIWIRVGYSYEIILPLYNWTDAEAKCLSQFGTHLATLTSISDVNEAKALCPNGFHCWFGANDIANEGIWIWASGYNGGYVIPWDETLQGDTEDCGCIFPPSNLGDCECSSPLYSLCDSPPTVSPSKSPSYNPSVPPTPGFVLFMFVFWLLLNSLKTKYIKAPTSFGQWISVTDTPVLPRSSYGTIVGHDPSGDIICLIGGLVNGYQLVSYNVETRDFTDHGQNYLPTYLQFHQYGFGQTYTQIGDILWMTDYRGNYFNTFNTKTLEFVFSNHGQYLIPVDVNADACLASSQNYLFVVGGSNSLNGTGYNYLDLLQIYDVSLSLWKNNLPKLLEKRSSLACFVHNEYLYAIGGVNVEINKVNYLATVEMLFVGNDLLNIHSEQWQYIGDLSQGVRYPRAALYGHDILVIGGLNGTVTNRAVKEINVINTATHKITLSGTLAFPTYLTAAIVKNDIAYAFAGLLTNGAATNHWQYINLPYVSLT